MRVVKMSPSRAQGVRTAANRASKVAKSMAAERDKADSAIFEGTRALLATNVKLIPDTNNPDDWHGRFVSPDSSNVKGATYSSLSRTLRIEFKTGTYRYDNVPVELWYLFDTAPSKGKFVNAYIIGPDPKNPKYKGVRQ